MFIRSAKALAETKNASLTMPSVFSIEAPIKINLASINNAVQISNRYMALMTDSPVESKNIGKCLQIWDKAESKSCGSIQISESLKTVHMWTVRDKKHILLEKRHSQVIEMWNIHQTDKPALTFPYSDKADAQKVLALFADKQRYLRFHPDTNKLCLWQISHEEKPLATFNSVKEGYTWLRSDILLYENEEYFLGGLFNQNKTTAICLWHIKQPEQPVAFFQFPLSDQISNLTFLLDRRHFLGSISYGLHGEIFMWDSQNPPQPVATFKGPKGQPSVKTIIPLPDGEHFIAHYTGYGAWLWNIHQPDKCVAVLCDDLTCLQQYSYLEPDGSWVYLDGKGNFIRYHLACMADWKESMVQARLLLLQLGIHPGVDQIIFGYLAVAFNSEPEFFNIPSTTLSAEDETLARSLKH